MKSILPILITVNLFAIETTNNSRLIISETAMNWVSAVKYCDNQSYLKKKWKLTTIHELQAMIDITKSHKNNDLNLTKSFWSSTNFNYNNNAAWYINFDDGRTHYKHKKHHLFTLCILKIVKSK